jgi:hypothetical protein
MGFLFDKLAGVKKKAQDEIAPDVATEQRKSDQFKRVYGDLKKKQGDLEQVVSYIENRYYWADVLSELRLALIRAEQLTRAKFRTETGIWLEDLRTTSQRGEGTDFGFNAGPAPGAVTPPAASGFSSGADNEAFRKRYGLDRSAPPAAAPPAADPAQQGQPGQPVVAAVPQFGTNGVVTMTFRAISLINTSGRPEANQETAYQALAEIANSPLFDPAQTRFASDIGTEEPPGTFTFSITAKLKKPLKL